MTTVTKCPDVPTEMRRCWRMPYVYAHLHSDTQNFHNHYTSHRHLTFIAAGVAWFDSCSCMGSAFHLKTSSYCWHSARLFSPEDVFGIPASSPLTMQILHSNSSHAQHMMLLTGSTNQATALKIANYFTSNTPPTLCKHLSSVGNFVHSESSAIAKTCHVLKCSWNSKQYKNLYILYKE